MDENSSIQIPRLLELQSKLGCSWKNIADAVRASASKRASLESLLIQDKERPVVEDAGIVFFGSVARGECTASSDADWIVLVDGQVDAKHFQTFHKVREALIEAKEISPGSSGMFGGLAFSHDIVHRIGGQDDTNRNLTLRMLLLLESVSIGDDIVRQRVIRAILQRYLADDPSWALRSDGKIPRFLLNDAVRFWRTMAVDFADKFHDQFGEKWALRNVKLRLSRKLIFLVSLLACFSWHLRRKSSNGPYLTVETSINYFAEFLGRPSLEIVADELLNGEIAGSTCSRIMNSYDRFLGILNNAEMRDELEELPRDLANKNELFQQVRDLSHTFRDGLNEWLFDREGQLFELVRNYAIF